MSDYISREAASADECKHKIKTPFAKIIVGGTPEKPYYNIWYFDPTDGECHIGFGSYCLDNVFNWLAEEFEITELHTDIIPVVHGRWEYIPQTLNTLSQLRCPFCRWWSFDPSIDGVYNYCPGCGCKMNLEDENGT